MARPKRDKTQKANDAAIIEHYALMKTPVRRIAEILNARGLPYTISYRQVQYDIEKMRQQWQAEAMRDVGKIRSQELAGLDKQEEECWKEWHKSRESRERTLAEKTEGGTGSGGKTKVSKITEAQCADVSYMNTILAIRDRRAKLLGLDAPAKQEFSGPGGGPIKTEALPDLSKLSVAELEQLDTIAKRLTQPAGDSQGAG